MRILLLLLFFSIGNIVNAQFLCDYEYKVINQQKRKLKGKSRAYAKEWITQHRDSLNIPAKVKIGKLKYNPLKDEYKNQYNDKWHVVDSMLCVNERKEYVTIAKQTLEKNKITVFEIAVPFIPTNAQNPIIKSSLHFQYDIYGKVLRTVLRIKTMSKTSEIYFH